MWTIRTAGAFGVSRLFVKYALAMTDPLVANRAAKLTPADPEAHFASGVLMSLESDLVPESLAEMEQAVAARPADYTLWMQLGLLRERAGDKGGALAAFNEAMRLAPFYAKPRWMRGNLLVRSGQYESGFADMRQAAQSDPELIPNIIDLAWGLTKGDPQQTEQLARIDNPQMRLVFAKLLAKYGKAKDAIEQFRIAGNVPEDTRQTLIEQLMSKEAYAEAFQIWNVNRAAEGVQPKTTQVYDGGFEGSLGFDEIGFGWRFARNSTGASVSLDSNAPHAGSKSLRVQFEGTPNLGISQLILVEPSKDYKLNFAARSQEIVTGGLPMMVINDASSSSGRKVLGRSPALPKGNSDWQTFSFQFTTGPETTAVVLSLERENCTTSPCPIFGAILLDSFSIEQLR